MPPVWAPPVRLPDTPQGCLASGINEAALPGPVARDTPRSRLKIQRLETILPILLLIAGAHGAGKVVIRMKR